MSPPSVIVVEDDDDLRASVLSYLNQQGIPAQGARDAAELNVAWRQAEPDIVVLDVGLPDENGFAIASRLRQSSTVGIVMMTALGQEGNRVFGLECGADIYLVKPISLREIHAAINRLHQRMGMRAGLAEEAPAAQHPSYSCWQLDLMNWTLYLPDGRQVRLTGSEFRFIALFQDHPAGTIIPYDHIFRVMGRDPSESASRSLESLIARLRRKVLDEGGHSLPLRASHGRGYSLQCRLCDRDKFFD